MESKVLTALQKEVLNSLFNNGIGERGYYLTGGTALAEFYLQHRYSDDLDIFTRKPNAVEKDFDNFRKILTSLGLVINHEPISTDFVRLSVYPEGQPDNRLKIEFARDAGKMMNQPVIHEQIVVDSFEDIAVNKVCAIYGRQPPEPKDFCDLFFVLKESRFSLQYLIGRASEKEAPFDVEDGEFVFATNLLAVSQFQKLPRMIKPLSLDELKTYFLPIAEGIIQRLRPRGG